MVSQLFKIISSLHQSCQKEEEEEEEKDKNDQIKL
jgi:hypothetical protein